MYVKIVRPREVCEQTLLHDKAIALRYHLPSYLRNLITIIDETIAIGFRGEKRGENSIKVTQILMVFI